MSNKSQLVGWSTDDRDVSLSLKLAETETPTILASSPKGLTIQAKKSLRTTSPSKNSFEERVFSDSPASLRRSNSTINKDDLSLPKQIENQLNKPKKEMTKAERRALQEKQRAEKAARQVAQGKGNTQPSSKQNPQQKSTNPTSNVKSTTPTPSTELPVVQLKPSKSKSKKSRNAPSAGFLFTHLSQFDRDKPATLDTKAQKGEIHPAIISLGLQYASFSIAGGNARCMAMLQAFKKVISDYITPESLALTRHLTTYLGKQIDYINTARSLAASMKTAIRFVKNEIATLKHDMPEEDAKVYLCERIDHFIRERIIFPMQSIVEKTVEKIQDGDNIMTYGCSSLVLAILKAAIQQGKMFHVTVIDSKPKYEGKEMIRQLSKSCISCSYLLINSLGIEMKNVNKVILGASAVFSNGTVMSRVGTATVAMMAHENKVPVVICAETYKFSDSVRLDSFVWNEMGDPKEIMESKSEDSQDWQSIPSLNVLNLLYDITPAQFVTTVVCEAGFIPSTSVPTVLREMGHYSQQ